MWCPCLLLPPSSALCHWPAQGGCASPVGRQTPPERSRSPETPAWDRGSLIAAPSEPRVCVCACYRGKINKTESTIFTISNAHFCIIKRPHLVVRPSPPPVPSFPSSQTETVPLPLLRTLGYLGSAGITQGNPCVGRPADEHGELPVPVTQHTHRFQGLARGLPSVPWDGWGDGWTVCAWAPGRLSLLLSLVYSQSWGADPMVIAPLHSLSCSVGCSGSSLAHGVPLVQGVAT